MPIDPAADVVVQLKKTNSLLERILESNTIKSGTPGSVEDTEAGPTVVDAMNRIDEVEEWIANFLIIDKNNK